MKQKILLINDEQLVEGLIGAFGTATNSIIFKYMFKLNTFLSILLAWIFTWFLRKIVINFYKSYKTNKNKKGYGLFFKINNFS